MSVALLTTRDGITGHWDGQGELTPKPIPQDEDYLDNLGLFGQSAILEHILCADFKVVYSAGRPEIRINNVPMAGLAQPPLDYFKKDLVWVRAYADLRGDRIEEIQLQLNDLLSFFGALGYLDLARRKYTMMMLEVARRVTYNVEVVLKYMCRAPRPVDYSMKVQPIIQTPSHSSYPSGHAMEAFAVATVLHRLAMGEGPLAGIQNDALPFKLAHRIAVNRTVAGVHFPIDSYAGASVGCLIGDAIYSIAKRKPLLCGDVPLPTANTDGETPDFLLSTLSNLPQGRTIAPNSNAVATYLWNKAAGEWA